jgi:predicted AAA+ superfamily ATPase
LKTVLLGSAPLLIARGLTESLAGRFELLHLPHWTFAEMRDAFGWSLDQYVFHGGYPGAAPLIGEPRRWARYVLDALVETSISRDVLLLTRVDKPALLRRLFELACRYSGQVLSYTKMLGPLQDAGNTTTLAHYLDLLAAAGMVTGLPKYAGDAARSRGSSPKLQVYNTALMTAGSGLTLPEVRSEPELWGRLVESSVGAHLANAAAARACELFYWRDRNQEVDFVVKSGRRLVAIEVKSGRAPHTHPGIAAFAAAFRPQRSLLIGADGIAVEEFLARPVSHWVQA